MTYLRQSRCPHRLREETAVLRARITAQAHGEIADEHAKLASKHPVFSS
jgi:hypothetical protein